MVFLAVMIPVPSVEADVTIDGDRLRVETATLSAVFERGVLVSLVRRSDGHALVRASADGRTSVFLVYPGGEAVPLGTEVGDRFTLHRINDHRAEIRVEAYDGDGVMTVSDDPANGDLIVELGAYSSRPGVRSCRWLLAGITGDLELVAPFFQGIQEPLEHPLIRDSFWYWPHRWEAGFAILQGPTGGFWVHCRDTRFLYKALKVGMPDEPRCLGFDTDAYGPIDDNLSAGGLAWRVNVFDGEWQVPAAAYRAWLAGAYGIENQELPGWADDVSLALSWCPIDPAVLDALAERISPGKVLLHVAAFRRDRNNYPDYTPSAEGAAFIKKAQDMGFRVFPHVAAIDIDPQNPAYNFIRDFQYRELENKKIIGWTWRGEGPVPESHATRIRLREEDRRVNIRLHPGLGMWRSILTESVLKLYEELSLTALFLDVTMNTHNVHNALVENTTPTEGMKKLQTTIKSLGKGLMLGGEGRNEITMQDQIFSQVHLFQSWHENIEGLEGLQPIRLGEFLFGRWSRSFGYSRLSGRTDWERFRMKRQVEMGAIPTITIRTAEEITSPNAGVELMLDMATGMQKKGAIR
jgi:hypothetical protein